MHNARVLADCGAAEIVEETASGETLSQVIAELAENSQRLNKMAEAAHFVARADAAERVAGIILTLAADFSEKEKSAYSEETAR